MPDDLPRALDLNQPTTPVRVGESEGNGFKRGRAPRLPRELAIEGGELPGIPNTGQMQRVGEVKAFIEPVQGFGCREFILQEHSSEPCQGPQGYRQTFRREAI